jgi:hypothetical protein
MKSLPIRARYCSHVERKSSEGISLNGKQLNFAKLERNDLLNVDEFY